MRTQSSSTGRVAFGLDFGTTNSSLARATAVPGGPARVEFAMYSAQHPSPTAGIADDRGEGLAASGAETASFRSLLYFEPGAGGKAAPRGAPGKKGRGASCWSGPAAIARYLDHATAGHIDEPGRLVQSLKSYLPSRSLTGTEIFGRRYLLEDLVSRMLRDLREGAEAQFGERVEHAVVGRPVHFVGADTAEDEAYALERLRKAYALAGFASVEFEYEPVAAAYAYAAGLRDEELLLIGDFGGGTSDFCLLRVGRPGQRAQLLGTSGVGLAGDAFDAKLVRRLVSPALGAESLARSMGTKLLPAVPAWIYANLERWHYLSFLRTRNVLEILKGARVRALEPEKIEALLTLIDEDLGYQLHQAVQRVKYALSSEERAEFAFRDGSMDLRIAVERTQFEGWIAEELAAVEGAVDGVLREAGVERSEVDRVFLTGGTSFVPAVRRIFTERFGEERVRTGDAFTSVAHGLALCALEVGV